MTSRLFRCHRLQLCCSRKPFARLCDPGEGAPCWRNMVRYTCSRWQWQVKQVRCGSLDMAGPRVFVSRTPDLAVAFSYASRWGLLLINKDEVHDDLFMISELGNIGVVASYYLL